MFQSDLPNVGPKYRKIVSAKSENDDNDNDDIDNERDVRQKTESVHGDIDKIAGQALSTQQSDSEEAFQILLNKKRSFSPSPLDSIKKKNILPSEQSTMPAADNSELLYSETHAEPSILTAPVPLHARLSASSLISPTPSKSLDRQGELACVFTAPSRPDSPLTLSSVLASLQSPHLPVKTSSTLAKSSVSFDMYPVKESQFRDMMETAIPYYPLIQNGRSCMLHASVRMTFLSNVYLEFVKELLTDKSNDFYTFFPAQSYELAQTMEAFMNWKACKQKSVEASHVLPDVM